MRRSQLGEPSRQNRLRRPGAWLVVAAAALGTGICAAQIAATPDDPGELGRTITRQKIEAGQLVKPDNGEHQAESLSAEQMLTLTASYETEMRAVIDRGETLRVVAYRSKDIIRMTCIDAKLTEMRTVLRIVEPRFATIHAIKHDELTLRGQYSLIHQAWDRAKTLGVELEACMGDQLDMLAIDKINNETPETTIAGDPTRPQDPNVVIDRPPEASTYQ